MTWSSDWTDPRVAEEQRALVDKQIDGSLSSWPQHLRAFGAAVAACNCPGTVLEVGCASGYGREVLDRAGLSYRSYEGIDISPRAIEIARERCPESTWIVGTTAMLGAREADVVIDGCALMHLEDWRTHLLRLARASRRWLILSRVPIADGETKRIQTHGYGLTFDAWSFAQGDLNAALLEAGFGLLHGSFEADGDAETLIYMRRRHFVTYFDEVYEARGRLMIESLGKHLPAASVHVLEWHRDKSNAATFMAEVAKRRGQDRPPGPERSRVETMWTYGPEFIAEIMRKTGEPVTYLDADLMFFSTPEPFLAAASESPCAVVPHGFVDARQALPGPTVQSHGVFGTFNVGMIHFRDRNVVEKWADDCWQWCYDRVAQDSDGRWLYGDQRYLDRWPQEHGAYVAGPHVCPGPWGIHAHALDVRDGVVHFGGSPLIAYHYSAYKELPHGVVVNSRPEYAITERQEAIIYHPYTKALHP